LLLLLLLLQCVGLRSTPAHTATHAPHLHGRKLGVASSLVQP